MSYVTNQPEEGEIGPGEEGSKQNEDVTSTALRNYTPSILSEDRV